MATAAGSTLLSPTDGVTGRANKLDMTVAGWRASKMVKELPRPPPPRQTKAQAAAAARQTKAQAAAAAAAKGRARAASTAVGGRST